MTLDITAIDLFCGAGGSSTGLVNAGVRVQTAVNHWRLAIDTHSRNHPETDHDCADIRQVHPSFYPRTDIFWASPECTNHSLAKGKRRKNIAQMDLWGETQVDPEEERSRATMREVIEFAAYHHHEIVVVENVVDIRHWAHFDSWLTEMINLGYDYQLLYLNAQFFNVPQSRDRIYVVFWKKGNRRPNLDFRPPAVCAKHGQVEAVQAWKKSGATWGRYKRQYIYVCPKCGAEVAPAHTPAAAAIDWTLPAPKIGEREHPLKPKTLQRIKTGIQRYARKAVIVDTAYADPNGYVRPVDDPLSTQTTRQTFALLQPFISSQHENADGSSTRTRSLSDPMPCLTTFNNEHQLVIPPFIAEFWGTSSAGDVSEPLAAIPTVSHHGLVLPPLLMFMQGGYQVFGVDELLHTLVAQGSQHALITPPFLMSLNHSDERTSPVDRPFPTIMTQVNPTLVIPEPGELDIDAIVPECGFRMLEPHELQRGMSFPDSYVILGNKRDKVRQIGNAVCPNVAEWIIARCVESLS